MVPLQVVVREAIAEAHGVSHMRQRAVRAWEASGALLAVTALLQRKALAVRQDVSALDNRQFSVVSWQAMAVC